MGRISCPDFVDRVEESRALDAALERASEGGTPTVFVGGEAGIGKSRLVGEFCRRATGRGARVLTGGCAPFGRSPPPFTPVVTALRAFTRAAGAAERARLASTAPALTWLLPELGGADAAWRKLAGVGSGPSLVLAQLLAVLEDVAAARPLVVMLEDLHWADRSTLDLLALRAQTAQVPNCAEIATYRSDELGPGHPLRLLLAELNRTGQTERLELRRFGRAELVVQMTGILGRPPGYEVIEDVLGRSDGNPFLCEELLAARNEEGSGTPSRVRDIVLARVETLSEPARRVLGILSAARGSLPHDALVAVSGMPERDLEAALREALARHVLVKVDDGAYGFRHALTREALYDGLLPGERERVHGQLARALEARRMTGDVTLELLADRAHQWYSAGDRRRGLESAMEAGLAADEVCAHAEALAQYERALELWGLVERPERLAGMDRVALRARFAEAASSLGEPLRAARSIERALEELDPFAEPLRAGVMQERLGRYAWIGGDADAALAAYEDAVSAIPHDPPSTERARAIVALGHGQLISNRYRVALELCAEGLEVARAAGARVEEARALATLGAATASLGDDAHGLRMVREGRALLERARATPDLAFVTYAFESRALADGGDFEAALEAARPGIELMRRRGMHRSHQAWLEAVVASSLIKLGRWSEATAVLDAALARGPMGITRRFVQLLRAELALARGDLAAAPDSLVDGRSAARGDRPFTGKLFEIASGLAVARRDFDSARSSAGDGLAALEALDDAQANVWLCWRGLQGEADRAQRARASGRVAEAESAVEVANGLLERARAVGRRQTARSAAEIPVLLLSCDADHARVTSRPAADAWVAAAAGWASLREPYPRAYCLVRGVDAGLAERRSKAGIAAMLSSAREIAAELGAEPLGRCAESLARRGRVAITSRGVESHEHEPAARAPLGLTPREIDVLRLVGQGYTNGQIADTLFISRKTAAAHVSNILHKLGADRRAEAAAIAARLDLLDEPSLT